MDNDPPKTPAENFGSETPDAVAFLELAAQIGDRMDKGDGMGAMALISPAKSAAEKISDRTKRQNAENAIKELENGLQKFLNQNSPHIGR